MARQKNKKSGFIDNYTELVLKYIKDYDRFISKIAYEVKLKCPKEDVEDIKQQIIYTIFTKRENIKSDLKHMRKDDFDGLDVEIIDYDLNKQYQALYENCFFKELFERVPSDYKIMLDKQYRCHNCTVQNFLHFKFSF